MEVSPAQTSGGYRDRRPDALGDFNVIPDELICYVLENLTPKDVARLACVSSVMYIFCNEEPLWMGLSLSRVNGPLQYKGSWKKTALHLDGVPSQNVDLCHKVLYFDGFYSLFLHRRLYRCNTTLNGFNFDDGNLDRRKDLNLEEFSDKYDGKKPVLLTGLAATWPARSKWTIEQLSARYGDMAFGISQRSSRKVSMSFKDYVSYTIHQHDEDPLYIFDNKFGEAAPDLLKDYSVPHLFEEDFFDVLDKDQRPPFRWLIIGPERSGASWHVDPALTSAWNTLLCGRKRWALYPPGRTPMGVTVHVNDEDGDVHIDTPSSLQWWLDFYPLLADEDKPIECTQLPGETIFVPSGWWHCVLNLETTVAVTQNFVNSTNFEFVCLDMAPGYLHKGVCRAGFLAVDEVSSGVEKTNSINEQEPLSCIDLQRKEKRIKIQKYGNDKNHKMMEANSASKISDLRHEFSYNIHHLATYLDPERDHYNAPWSSSNSIGQREMREWLSKLWVQKPGIRELIWKGACLALNASKWLKCLSEICVLHNMPSATDDEKLPVGTGSNPVYLVEDRVVKIFVEGGLEASLYCLGTELQFYNLLSEAKSQLKNHVPEVLACGILYYNNGSYNIVPWDGKSVPDVIRDCNLVAEGCIEDDFPFGIWKKKQFEYRKAGMPMEVSITSNRCTQIWPYIITTRCKGKIFAQLRDILSWEDALSLATFLGEQVRNLHLLPYPPHLFSYPEKTEQKIEALFHNGVEHLHAKLDMPVEWDFLIRTLTKKKRDVVSRLTNWGHPIPQMLIEKVNEYLPNDFAKFFNVYQDENGMKKVSRPCSWIHSDIMDDNIHMEMIKSDSDVDMVCGGPGGSLNGHDNGAEGKSWRASHLLDFSDISIGDPLNDIIPIYLDVFRGDSTLFKRFLESYKLPLMTRIPWAGPVEDADKFSRLSYQAMCYCIVHDDNILGAVFSLWRELRTAKSWEEVEQVVWGDLNNYKV